MLELFDQGLATFVSVNARHELTPKIAQRLSMSVPSGLCRKHCLSVQCLARADLGRPGLGGLVLSRAVKTHYPKGV